MNLSCRKAAQLMSEEQDRRLTPGERLALHAHLALCRGCRALAQQLATLRRALRRLFDPDRGG